MSRHSSRAPGLIVAELGPTNTGKTHRAIDRMLEHDSGMMGLPLRLLAREVYDRVSARVGEARVALITGEERRIPRHADYWICTVESMPVQRPVDFLAVDEVQLAAHRERGHVFTDRLLHARGRKETWFLGAGTMRPLLSSLLPGASFQRSTRLSQLRSFGRRSLKSLPPRAAVVAFSVERVYALAELLRQLRGGVAVVLGALSPRTRNAQVAMYQAGEVQYLVATDAIGMGLNLDLNHVAFAALSKFDGAEQRDLRPEELAQIAGRAGRHTQDGDFGTLNPLPELPPDVVSAIEAHRFDPVRTLIWRNPELDFHSPEALLESLAQPPPNAAFLRVERADDFDALKALSGLKEIRDRLSDRSSLELLWRVCQIPNFRKGLFGQHVAVLRDTFLQLAEGDGQLHEDWLTRELRPLSDTRGDIHTLTDRLAAIRVWTYITQRPGWIREAAAWQERTRRIEDSLGDALHERLVERFVERTARASRRRFASPAVVVDAAHPFAKLQALGIEQPMSEARFVQQLVAAEHRAFQVDSSGRIRFAGEAIARLVRGNGPASPQISLVDSEIWTAGARRQLERRLLALARDLVSEALGDFPASALSGGDHPPALRGLAYRLARGFGVVSRSDALEQWSLIDDDGRRRLSDLGVREGARFLYVENALTPLAFERRCMLMALHSCQPVPPGAPGEFALPISAFAQADPEDFGYEPMGRIALRFDVAERIAKAFHSRENREQTAALFQGLPLSVEARADVERSLGVAEHRKRRRRRKRARSTDGSDSTPGRSHGRAQPEESDLDPIEERLLRRLL